MSLDTYSTIKDVLDAGVDWFTEEVSSEIDTIWEVMDFYWNLVQYEFADMMDRVKGVFGSGTDIYTNIVALKTDVETKLNTKYSIAVVTIRSEYADWMAKAKVMMNTMDIKSFILNQVKTWIFGGS